MSAWATSGGHPAIEEIAAAIDGRLDDAARQRLHLHLADCEDCYDLFAATARHLHDEGLQGMAPAGTVDDEVPARVLRPASGRWRRGGWIAATLAAAAGVAALLVWSPARDLRSGGPPTVAQLTAELPAAGSLSPVVAAGWEDHGWGVTRARGPAIGPQEELAFRIGVRMVEMDVALAAGEAKLAEGLAVDLERLLDAVELADPLAILYGSGSGLGGSLRAGEPPAGLLALHRQGDAALSPSEADGGHGFVDATWYALGKWAGAAHLAAASGDAAYFRDRSTRRELRRLAGEALPAEVGRSLRQVEELAADDPAAHLPEIGQRLDDLIAVAGGGGPATSGAS